MITILNPREEHLFEHPPLLDFDQRKGVFEVTPWCRKILRSLYSDEYRVGFMLQWGYFLRTHRFFPIQSFRYKDIVFVSDLLQIKLNIKELKNYHIKSFRRHQKQIIHHLGWQKYGALHKKKLEEEVFFGWSKQILPHSQFWGLVEYLEEHHIALPSYKVFEKLIVQGFTIFENQLLSLVDDHLTPAERRLLDSLLEADNSKPVPTTLQRCHLTLLRKINYATKPTQMVQNAQDLAEIQSLFEQILPLINKLKLTPETIRYYAQQVINTRIFQIRQRDKSKYLFLIAFIIHHYYTLSDALIDALLQCVQQVTSAAKKSVAQEAPKVNKTLLSQAKEILDDVDEVEEFVSEVHKALTKESLDPLQKVTTALELYHRKNPFQEKLFSHTNNLQQSWQKEKNKERLYDALSHYSIPLQRRVARILMTILFDESSEPLLLEAIDYFKKTDGAGIQFPIEFLPLKDQKALLRKQDKGKKTLYKILLFHAISKSVKGGSLNLRYSYHYRPLFSYFISPDNWEKNNDEILERSGLSHLQKFDAVERCFQPFIDEYYHKINQDIAKEENPYITVKDGKITNLITPRREDEEEKSTADLFPKKSYVSLLEVLKTVNDNIHFTDALTHWNKGYTRPKPTDMVFFGALMAYGTNIGLHRFSQMNDTINQEELESAANWYLSSKNLKEANDKVVAAITQMELSLKYRENPEVIHTSSDGQKKEVVPDSFYASYSPKYFNRGKGVSILSFVDETHAIPYATVINASEREATYVIDGLMHNKVIQSDRHSTDTHGATESVFALTHLLGIYFTPRIKAPLNEKLYSLRSMDNYSLEEYPLLRPLKQINTKIIREQWGTILWMAATIKLKENSASQLLNRLNSYSEKHPLREALNEFGKIVKTRFLLHYFDDMPFRQSTGKQLNSGENVNRFRNELFFGRGQQFQNPSKEEMIRINDCNTLIQNCIILWNYMFLSDLIN